MDRNKQKSQWWVEYIDDYNIKHLTLIQDKVYLQYLQNNYKVTIVENVKV